MSLLKEFSVQLHTLREESKNGFPNTLRKVAEIGYTGVEFAGYGGFAADEMKSLLSEYGLRSVGSHVPLERLLDSLDEELAYNRVIGTEYIVVPFYNMMTVQDVNNLAGHLTKISSKVKQAGFGFAYHNHAKEFATEKGRYLLDFLIEQVPAERLDIELDVFWAAYAEVDYQDWIRKNSDRVKLLHLKQIKDLLSRKCVDLGDGIIDFRKLIEIGKEIGVEHFILEQEAFAVSPFDSVKNGFEHIMSFR